MEIQTRTARAGDADVQALAVAVFKDERADEGVLRELDAAAGGLIKSVIDSEELKGKEGETVYLHLGEGGGGLKARRLLLVGVGERAAYGLAQVSQFAGTAARALRARNVKAVGLVARAPGDESEGAASAAVEGAIMGLFDLDKYRTAEKEERTIDRLVVVAEGADDAGLKRGAERGRVVGESVNFTRDLANEPGAYMTPTIMAQRAQQIGDEFGLEVDVLDRARIGGAARADRDEVHARRRRRGRGAARLHRQGRDVRLGRHLDQAGREHGADEVRHDGRRDRDGRDARRRAA